MADQLHFFRTRGCLATQQQALRILRVAGSVEVCARESMLFRIVIVLLTSARVQGEAATEVPAGGYTRQQLQPLTKFRQQHQRTVDGRLCAAAFVQSRKAYTGCTDAPDPSGMSGRPWCYVEAQVWDSFAGSWESKQMFAFCSCSVMLQLGIIAVCIDLAYSFTLRRVELLAPGLSSLEI